jgi:sugar phosphate isomerase/epimerase
MSGHLLSLASGVLPEFSPEQTAAAAIAAGWPAVGIWVEPSTWTAAVATEVRTRTRDAGTVVLDVEVIWLKPGADDPDHLRIIDAGAAIDARNVLVVSSDPDPQASADKLRRLSEHAADRAMRVCLEFAAFTEITSLAVALDVVGRASHPAAGLLIDPLHFARTGATPAMLHGIDPHLLPYAQFCDATAQGPSPQDVPAIIEEALDLRLDIATGGLPLRALIDPLPSEIPLSIELRSRALRDGFADPAERAAALLAATRSGMAVLGR